MYLSICISIYLSVYVSIYLHIYLFISLYSSPPAKYFLIFSNQKEKQHWEQLLRNTQVGPASSPMLSGHHRMMRLDDSNEYHNVSSGLDIHNSQKVLLPKYMSVVTLPSCRVGSQV